MMWKRFTEKARKVVWGAQEEAARTGHVEVAPEHFFLALLREKESVAGRLLSSYEVPFGEVLERTESIVMKPQRSVGADLQMTPEGKQVIELWYAEARALNNNDIGTEHILLGLVASPESLAAKELARFGVTLECVRQAARAAQAREVARRGPSPPESLPEAEE